MKIKLKLLIKKAAKPRTKLRNFNNNTLIIPHDQSHRPKYHFPGEKKDISQK